MTKPFIEEFELKFPQLFQPIRLALTGTTQEQWDAYKRSSAAPWDKRANLLALEPFKNEMDKETYKNLISISAILMGIDPLIASKDVCGLNNEESKRVLNWALEMILKGIDLKY